jgi:tetratricopeptide (TPR) repeat protein
MSTLPPLLAQAERARTTGRYGDHLALVEHHLEETADPEGAAAGWARHVNALRMCGQLDAAIAHGERYVAAARADGRRAALAECLRVLAAAESARAEQRRVEALLDEALAIAEADGLHATRARALRALALHRMNLGRYAAAEGVMRRAFVAARDSGDPLDLAWSYLLQARLDRGLGRLDVAERVLEEAAQRFPRAGHPYGACQTYLMQVSLALARKDAAKGPGRGRRGAVDPAAPRIAAHRRDDPQRGRRGGAPGGGPRRGAGPLRSRRGAARPPGRARRHPALQPGDRAACAGRPLRASGRRSR